ncbi:hypothetical protein [Williamsia herbipolensis]|uniref:hypothetical protein n=1 Tax=Williamsia herbipolensis TaxID=1603258 RepID=UPI000696B42B|nr:hypothetical protein [Williamsia herbipolensis]
MARDLNGHPVATGGLQRLFGRLRGGSAAASEPAPGDPDLVVVAECFDDTAAASSVLADSAWREPDQAVLRHLLVVPSEQMEAVAETAAQDGYEVVDADGIDGPEVKSGPGMERVALARTQLVDALHCSQERSRMAGLGARHDGTVLGWQVLQRPES